jgi:predicted RNA-binding protein
MCLSTVYNNEADVAENMICEYVTSVDVDGDTILLRDILGNVTDVKGSLQRVDLVKNIIVIASN